VLEALSLRLHPWLLRELRDVLLAAVGELLPFIRKLQPGLAVLGAQRALGLFAALVRLLAVMFGFTSEHATSVVGDC
jgi:hypothetical protein